MPGMNSGLNPANPILVSAFRTALVHQWAIVALIFALLLIAWGATRTWVTGREKTALAAPAPWHEPGARRLLRVGFGILYVISASGRVRQEFSDDPGPGTGATKSSFAGLLASSVVQTMGQG
jgi:hypothetical protein